MFTRKAQIKVFIIFIYYEYDSFSSNLQFMETVYVYSPWDCYLKTGEYTQITFLSPNNTKPTLREIVNNIFVLFNINRV